MTKQSKSAPTWARIRIGFLSGGWRDAAWLFAFIAMFILILQKCPYGFANRDESFYLTIPYRLCQGDGLLWDEYHLSQLSSVLIYPIMRLYLWLAPSTEGMLLAFRYIFTCLHAATAVFLYLRLRKVSVNALFASILYLLFTPFGIMALSYNSMGIALITIAAVLVYTNPDGGRVVSVLAGLAFAGAVLCCPYLLLVYLYYGVLVAVDFVGRKVRPTEGDSADTEATPLWKPFLFFTAGCVGAALLFFLFLVSRASVGEILDALPLILTDPEHPSRKFTAVLTEFLTAIVGSNERAPVLLLGVGAVSLAITADRKKERHAPLYLLATAGLVLYYTYPFITENIYLNYLMFPLSAFGLPCYLLLGRKGLGELLTFWVPGVLYGICMTWSSNQRFYVISDAALLASVGSLVLLGKVCASLTTATAEPKRSGDLCRIFRAVTRGALVLMLCGYVMATAEVRYNSLFWETGKTMADMTEEITVGAERGIYTTAYKKATYEKLYRQSAPVREHEGASVLYFTKDTWLYLDDQKTNAAYSAWTSGVSASASQKMVDYYTLNPDKIPDVIFVYQTDWKETSPLAVFFAARGYEKTALGNAYMLEKPAATAK